MTIDETNYKETSEALAKYNNDNNDHAFGTEKDTLQSIVKEATNYLGPLGKDADTKLKAGVSKDGGNSSGNAIKLMEIQRAMHSFTQAAAAFSSILKKQADVNAQIIQKIS